MSSPLCLLVNQIRGPAVSAESLVLSRPLGASHLAFDKRTGVLVPCRRGSRERRCGCLRLGTNTDGASEVTPPLPEDPEKPDPDASDIENAVRQTGRWLERQLIAFALGISIAFIVLSFVGDLTASVPNSIVLMVRQFAVGLLVAALAAVFIPRLLRKDELREAVVDFVRDEVRRAIKEQTSRIEDQTEKIKDQTGELYRGAASLATLQKVGVTRVYATRAEADADLAADLDARPEKIRVLGLSLNDMAGRHPSFSDSWRRLCRLITEPVDPPIDVRIMVLDPETLGAALRSQGEGDLGDTSGLKRDVDRTLDQLKRLFERHQEAGGTSFDYRLYRIAPQLFLCKLDSVAYVEPYYFGGPPDEHGEHPIPLLRCEGDDLLADLETHFDLIWEFASVTSDEHRAHAAGVDKGVASTALQSIFFSPVDAAPRIDWVVREPWRDIEPGGGDLVTALEPGASGRRRSARLWLQGNSLISFFRDGEDLHRAVLAALEMGAELRALVLHPFCLEAQYRSYREQLLLSRAESLSFASYFADGKKHDRSKLVTDTTQTVQHIFDIQASSDYDLMVKLYASAPSCFLLLTDNRAMVEQYHFGKHSSEGPILGKEMPIVEYARDVAGPPSWRANRSPYSLLENHFEFVWDHLAVDPSELDLAPDSGRKRARSLEAASLGSAVVE